jgi:hypothetical protein
MLTSLPEKDVADEGSDDLVDPPEISAHDRHCDDDGNGALDHLGPVRPVHLVELGPRLTDEPAAALGVVLDRSDGSAATRSRGRLWDARPIARSRVARSAARIAPLPPGLVGHGYLVSRWIVWEPHQRQYFLNSTLSGEFRFDFSVW